MMTSLATPMLSSYRIWFGDVWNCHCPFYTLDLLDGLYVRSLVLGWFKEKWLHELEGKELGCMTWRNWGFKPMKMQSCIKKVPNRGTTSTRGSRKNVWSFLFNYWNFSRKTWLFFIKCFLNYNKKRIQSKGSTPQALIMWWFWQDLKARLLLTFTQHLKLGTSS